MSTCQRHAGIVVEGSTLCQRYVYFLPDLLADVSLSDTAGKPSPVESIQGPASSDYKQDTSDAGTWIYLIFSTLSFFVFCFRLS